MSLRVITGCIWNWCLSGVKSVTVDFGGEIKSEYIAPVAQLVSALDFNFERAVEGSILTAGKRLSLKNLNVIIRAIN